MLNISKNSINDKADFSKFKSIEITKSKSRNKVFLRITFVLFIVLFLFSLLPWTQNVRAKGYVTALRPDQRPQTVNSIIAGRIDQWIVAEGDFVEKGDTLAIITETKDSYFNPNLLSNTESQINAKESSVNSYLSKVNALDKQISALYKNKELKTQQALNKIEQAKLKIKTDSTDLLAIETNLTIARNQLERAEELYNDGLKSLSDLEEKRNKFQAVNAKKIAQENKLLTSRNLLINYQVEYSNIENEFTDKIAKSESDKFASLSSKFEAENQLSKLENQYANYAIRSGFYFILAPQTGYVTKVLIPGIGETIKEGAPLLSIMPANAELAVEMYVKPLDLPLINKGQIVRIQFDGWPAIVFSGWKGMSFGMFDGKVVAIDNFTSDNNLYRVLVAPFEEEKEWPGAIRVGAGARTITMLEDVPIWYEVWRNINGFPPKFYQDQIESKKKGNKVLKTLKPK